MGPSLRLKGLALWYRVDPKLLDDFATVSAKALGSWFCVLQLLNSLVMAYSAGDA